MSIEQETFSHYLIQPEKLLFYGFEPDGQTLVYEKKLPEENFRICLRFDGEITGKILDLANGEEYTNFRVESSTGFGAEVRQQFTTLLEDIRDKCCRNQYFRSEQGRRINDYIFEKYHSVPEFLWPNIPSYAAFRRSGSKKWFAVIGSVPHGKRVKTFHASDACIDCLSCVQLCPEAAIDIGNITKKRERFPNKKITPAELSGKVIHIG